MAKLARDEVHTVTSKGETVVTAEVPVSSDSQAIVLKHMFDE